MNIACLSDIHGNAAALEAVIDDSLRQEVDRIFVLGDLCYRGLEPKRSLELVQSLNASVIRGNADEWMVRGVQKGEVPDQALEMMNRERDWCVARMDDADLQYLSGLPIDIHATVQDVNIHAFHATPQSLFEAVLPNCGDEELGQKLMGDYDADVYLYAHIHRPYIRYIEGKCVVNLGSVGLPFDGDPRASYALVNIEEGCVQTSIRRVAYEVNRVIEAFRQSDYPNREMMAKVLQQAKIG